MPLVLDERRLLPPGDHNATLDEVRQTFGRVLFSDRRLRLSNQLADYMDRLRRAGIGGYLLIDGSFVMGSVAEPADIDIMLVLPADWDMKQELRPQLYNLISRKDIRREFAFDVYVVREGSLEETKWKEFFAQVNIKWYAECSLPVGARKGLVRLAL